MFLRWSDKIPIACTVSPVHTMLHRGMIHPLAGRKSEVLEISLKVIIVAVPCMIPRAREAIEGGTMNLVRTAWMIRVAVVLALSVPALVSCAWGQEAKGIETPRDTLLAVARDMMAKARFCVLITLDATGHPRARAMDPFAPEENMVVWMGTSRVTRKVEEIRNDPRVTLYYAHPEGAGYVSLYGTAKLVDTPEETAKRWKEEWATFYPDKEASFILIAVTPERMEIVDYSRGVMGDPKTWIPAVVKF